MKVAKKTIEECTRDELFLLEGKVLPCAVKWVEKYPAGSPLFEAGLQTLEYWEEAHRVSGLEKIIQYRKTQRERRVEKIGFKKNSGADL